MIAASKGWKVQSTDIRSAFLQGSELERDVYIKPPKEAELKGKVWKLKKCLYGLNDASRQFYLSIKEVLSLNGSKQSVGNPSFFYLKMEDKLEGVIVSHIDDFLHTGSKNFDEQIVKPLKVKFSAGSEEEENFSDVGFQVTQTPSGILLHQLPYIAGLDASTWSSDALNDKQRDLTTKEQTEFRALVGSLNWCVQGTRPDLAFEQIELATKIKNAKVEDYLKAIKLLKRLKSTELTIMYPNMADLRKMEMLVYSDASFANLDQMGSAGAYMVFCRNVDTGRSCPIGWKANKVKRVVRSTLAAEGLALAAGLDSAIYLRNFLSETLGIKPNIKGIVDNKGLVENIHSTHLLEDRRLNLDLSAIKEMLERNEVESIEWCPKDQQLVDCMTKHGQRGDNLRKCLGSGKID